MHICIRALERELAVRDMNWDNARFFLTVARAGTLRGAARALGVDQATVGRRVTALEAELGARLFLRTPTMFVLTDAGEALAPSAEAMERAAHVIEHRIAGLDKQLAGRIRITTTESLGARFVMPALVRLRRLHPGIDIVCTTSSQIANLTRREADLAIRTTRPNSPDLITRRLGQFERGLYASRDYLSRRGEPRKGEAFAGHDLIVYQRPIDPLMWKVMCGEPIARGRIVFQASSTNLLSDAALAGLGITVLSVYRARPETQLVRVMPQCCDRYDVWMVAHSDLYKTARVQALIALLVDEFDREKVANGRGLKSTPPPPNSQGKW
jgi:DNA-binding transcriptional LysR family regulator